MSGWDVSSTPTWGSQEPDETQVYSASGDGSGEYDQNFGAPGTGGGYSGGNMAGGPPSEFFGQEQSEGAYPRRTPGQSFQDLPRRGGAAAGGGYGQDNGFGGQEWRGGGAEDETMKWGSGGGQDAGYGQDWGAQTGGDSWSQQDSYGGYGQDSGFGGQEYGGQASGGYGGRGGGLPAQNDPALQDFFGGSQGGSNAGGGFGDQRGGGWSGGGDSARDAFNAGGNDDVDWTGRPRNRGAAATADADVDWTGRPKNRAAAAPGDGDVDWTGKPRGSRPSREEEDDIRGGMGLKALIAVGVVVLVIVIAGAYIVLKPKGSTSSASGSSSASPGGLMTSSGASPKAKAKTSTSTAAAAFTLATTAPASITASGATLPDTPANPNDLKIAETTAAGILTELSGKGAGTATSSTPTVAQAYNLPGGTQAMSLVGYEGTFTPTKVSSVLSGLGQNVKIFTPSAADPGSLGCANTPTAPSGAVCVWSTTSTLGITEFFGSTGPETVTSSTGQLNIGNDTLAAQAAVEKKAS